MFRSVEPLARGASFYRPEHSKLREPKESGISKEILDYLFNIPLNDLGKPWRNVGIDELKWLNSSRSLGSEIVELRNNGVIDHNPEIINRGCCLSGTGLKRRRELKMRPKILNEEVVGLWVYFAIGDTDWDERKKEEFQERVRRIVATIRTEKLKKGKDPSDGSVQLLALNELIRLVKQMGGMSAKDSPDEVASLLVLRKRREELKTEVHTDKLVVKILKKKR